MDIVKNSFILILASLAVIACGETSEDTPDPGDSSPTSVVIEPSDATLAPGESLTLTANVMPSNASQSVTWSSDDSSVATVTDSGVVNAQAQGSTDIRASSDVDSNISANASISVVANGDTTVDCTQANELSEDISSSQTLAADCYLVTSRIYIDEGAVLSIEAGSVLQFDGDVGFRVRDGAFNAVGSANNPIRFTSAESDPQAADWAGIRIDTNSPDNMLEHVIIEYAGDRRDSIMGARTYAAMRIGENAQVSIRNSTFRHNDVRALLLSDGARLADFHNNSFSANQGHPLQLEANQLGMLDADSNYAGEGLEANDDSSIDVRGSDVIDSQTWPATNAPYQFNGRAFIQSDTQVTIAAGARIESSSSNGIRVDDDAALSALGNADNPVTFSSAEDFPQAEDWAGIRIDSNNPDNVFEHVIVEYAGDRADNIMGVRTYAAVRVSSGAQLSIRNSTFRNNAEHALLLSDGARMADFSNNSFSDNRGYPLQLEANQLGMLDADSNYAGEGLEANDDNGIDVRDSDVTDSQTWPATNAPYQLNGRAFLVGDTEVTIAPGANFRVSEGNGIRVSDDAALIAVGTEDTPISFSGVSEFPNPGDWAGLHFTSNNPANRLEHAIIEYAGGRADNLMGVRTYAAVRVSSGGLLSLRDSRIAFSSEAGLKLDDDTTTIEPSNPASHNTITDNDVNFVDNR